MAGVLNEFFAAQKGVMDSADRVSGMADRGQLRQLAPRAIAGDPSAQVQAAAIDPAAAQQFGTQRDDLLTRARSSAQHLQAALKAGDAGAIAQARQYIKPFMDTLQPGKSYPLDMDPAQELQGVEAFIAQTDGIAGLGGNDLKSLRVGQDGYYYAIQGGQLVNTGVRAADNLKTLDLGEAGIHSFNQRSGSAAPVTTGGQPSPSSPTRFRSGETGEVIDISQVSDPALREQIAANPQAFGLAAETGAPLQLPSRDLPPQQYNGGGQSGAPLRKVESITPYQQAQLSGQARDDVRAERSLQLQEDAARQKQAEQQREIADKQRAAQGTISTLQASIDSIDSLLNSPDLGSIVGLSSMNPLNRIPGTDARGLIARADQIAGQAFLAAFNQLKGGGAITEREGAAATAAMARLDRSQNLEDYKRALLDLKAAVEPAIVRARNSQQGGQSPAGSGIDALLEKYR